jgi:hypothetical protein
MTRTWLRTAVAGSALAIAACATDPPAVLRGGTWGAQGAEMVVGGTGADVTFNCASGEVTGPLTIGADGNFSWSGTYTRVFPAPGTPPDAAHAATYAGTATASQLSLTVSVPDIALETSPVVLTHGQDGELVLCP